MVLVNADCVGRRAVVVSGFVNFEVCLRRVGSKEFLVILGLCWIMRIEVITI